MELFKLGVIYSPFETREECPSNGWSSDITSDIVFDEEFERGLDGLEEGMRIHVLWWFDKAQRDVIAQNESKDGDILGVFAMRSPERPNPIALSLCEIEAINENEITVRGLEAIDKSIVLDIKKAVSYQDNIL